MSADPSGVDLARQALIAAREGMRKNGVAAAKKPKGRTGAVVDAMVARRPGSAARSAAMTEGGMVAPAAVREPGRWSHWACAAEAVQGDPGGGA